MAYTPKNWNDLPIEDTPITAADLDHIENGISDVDTRLTTVENGWLLAGETWTFASVDDPTGSITISGNVTGKYKAGMRIKFTNAANIIYGIITKTSYSSPNTTITFLHEIDPNDSLALYLMQNSAITNNFVSCSKSPCGFPLNPNKWSVIVKDVTERNQASPVSGTWYNLGGANISMPIGLWSVNYKIYTYISRASGVGEAIFVTLSTTNNGQSDSGNTLGSYNSVSTAMAQAFLLDNIIMELDSKTIYYINTMTDSTGISNIRFSNNQSALILKAVCAYL